jgi:hypothetical protein
VTDFFVVRVEPPRTPEGDIDFAVVGIERGSQFEVVARILSLPGYKPASYLLLEKNAPVIVKAKADA